MEDLAQLCIHTITTKPWPIEIAIEKYHAQGVRGISVWRQALDGRDPFEIGKRIRSANMNVVSLCRGGFFPDPDPAGQQKAIDDNLRAIDQAAELGAPLIVLVPGAIPGQSLSKSCTQIQKGIEAILPRAIELDIKLGIEALHPMYADSRSTINSLSHANDVCEIFNSPNLGVIVDVYHLWWERNLKAEINRCGQAGRIFAFHICDWKTPTIDMLNDRGLMGEGCIDIAKIRKWVNDAGFNGYHEVEIFSDIYWQMDQIEFLKKIIEAYLFHC